MAKPGMDLTAFVGKLLEEQDGDVLREGVRVLAPTGSLALRRIRALLNECGATTEEVHEAFQAPFESFGPFDDLPQAFRDSLRRAAYFHIQEASLLTTRVTESVVYGPVLWTCARLAHQGSRLRGSRGGRLPLAVGRLATDVARRSRILCEALVNRIRFTSHYRAPLLHTLWHYAKVDPWPLIQDYISHIPVDPRLATVYRCETSGAMSCGLIGIDLLPSGGRLHFLESNFNPGHYIERHLLSPDGDPVCRYLVEWAWQQGFRRIVFFPFNNGARLKVEVEEAWREMAGKKGIALEVVDDPYNPSRWPRSRRMFMDWSLPKVLYVNGRRLPGPLSRVISIKGLLDHQIRLFNAAAPEAARIPIPRLVLSEEDIPPLTARYSRFPNVIVKNANIDRAAGISLFKTNTLAPAMTAHPNIAYEYIPPDLVIERRQSETVEYVQILRAYLLLTPTGPVYLGARKDLSSAAIPVHLPAGTVQDISPYVTNLQLGGHSVPHSPAEEDLCRDAVLAIGRILTRYLERTHNSTVA